MTEQDFFDKYGEEAVTFSSYYKYSFTYEGTSKEGHRIVISYGGSADDIYRYDVDTLPVLVKDFKDAARFITVYDKDGNTIVTIDNMWW